MSQPTHLGHGVPESNASLAPAFVAAGALLLTTLAVAFPPVAVAVAGAVVTTALWSLADRARRSRRRGERRPAAAGETLAR